MDTNHSSRGPCLAISAVACAALLMAGHSRAQLPTDVELPQEFREAERVTQAALTFLDTLSAEQRNTVSFPLDSDNRGNWSNLPNGLIRRTGVRMGDLSEAQRIAVHHLLRAAMSSQGYLKVVGVMHMDEVLGNTFADPPDGLMNIDVGGFDTGPVETDRARPVTFSAAHYFISLFGEPDTGGGEWAFLLTGHHLAVSFTVAGGRVSFTPLFMGSQPLMIRRGIEAGWSPLYHESIRGFDLMESLTPEQQRLALISDERVFDVMAGPGQRKGVSSFDGLKASEMTSEQKLLLRLLVMEFVGNAGYDGARTQLQAIDDAGWDELWFSWQGPIGDPDDLFYYRVHGDRLLLELAWEARNHIHAIVRDPLNDYGEDWLGIHYTETHPDISAIRDEVEEQVRQGEASSP